MSNNPPPNPIKPISDIFIRPKHDDQIEQSKRQPYHFVYTDICFLPAHYLQKGLLFNKPQNLNIQAFLDKLKEALALALDYYYPLAGRLVTAKSDNNNDDEDDDMCWLYLDSNKGPGARFIHAVCGVATVDDVVKSEPSMIPIIRAFFELGEGCFINYDGHTRPLLCVQVTELIDGVFIGFTMNHCVVDGASFWNFVNSLSEIFNSMDANINKENLKISQAPIIKQIPASGCGPIIKLPWSKLNKLITQFRVNVDPNLSERIYHFSSSSIAKLKAQANANPSCDVSKPQISSFQSLSAFLWRSITRARSLNPDLVTTCTLIAGARPRFDPPLSSNHFGNLILPIQVSSNVGEVLEKGLGWVSMLLHQGVNSVDQNLVRDRCRSLFEFVLGPEAELAASVIGGETAVVIGGSVRFNMYGSEFGLGKAIAVRAGYSAKTDGKVTTNPGREGDGSVEMEISLLSKAMSALEQDEEFMSFVSQI